MDNYIEFIDLIKNYKRSYLKKIMSIVDTDIMARVIWSFEGRFIYANNKFLNIIGYTLDELRALKFEDFIHPDDIDRSMNEYSNNMNSSEDIFVDFYNRYITKQGKIVWLKWHKAINDVENGFGHGQVSLINEKEVPLNVLSKIK